MPTILLVEPNAAFRRMMEQELRKAGHEVYGAAEAITAARALREREFDLILIEMVIPGDITTADLLSTMRDDPPPGEPARIAMTAQGNLAAQEAFFRAEYALDGFLLKPFMPAKLRSAVDEAIAARTGRRGVPPIREWSAPGESAPESESQTAPANQEPPPAAEPPAELELEALAVPEPSAPATPSAVVELNTGDLVPLETNPGLVHEPAPSPQEFEAASAEEAISLEDLAPAPSTAERRAVERFPIRLALAVHDGKAPFRARSENISRSGVFVATDRTFEPGTKLRIRVELPSGGEGKNEIVVRVAHTARVAALPGLGLRFEDMSTETAQRLDAFLATLQAPSQTRPFLIVASHTLSAEVERVAQSYRNDEMRVRLVTALENVQEIAEADPPDLMLLDLADPVMVAFVGALKATRATADISVALVDRGGDAKSALLAAAAGADRFFALPGEMPTLVAFAVERLAASRRRSVRVRFQRPVTVWHEGAEITAAASDLSETGLQVRVAHDLPEQTPLELVIALTDGGPPIRANSRVTWKSPAGDGGTLGIRLGLALDIDDATRNRIRGEIGRALAASYYVRWLAAAPRAPKPAPVPKPV